MSIIIYAIYKNEKLFIASDKRAITNGFVNEEYRKVYGIKEKLSFGMTGIAQEGLKIYNDLLDHSNQPTSKIIKRADLLLQQNKTLLTITLAGKDESGNLFVWQKNNYGKIICSEIKINEVQLFMSTNENIDGYFTYLKERMDITCQLAQSMIDTIKYAASKDKSINNKIDFFEIV